MNIQTFSSETSKWMAIDLTPDMPLPYVPTYPVNMSAVVIGDVFCWFARGPRVVAFDMVERCFRSIDSPGGGYSVRLAAVNGLLHYGLSDGVDINIWVLKGDFHNSTAQWHMKHSVSFVTLENRYPDIFGAVWWSGIYFSG